MKTIVTVNIELPSVDTIEYTSGKSLLDYDIILFDPKLPFLSRIDFTGGGSCISIEGTEILKTAMNHWSKEIGEAVKAGKVVFFLLNEYESNSGAISYSLGARGARNYTTSTINNYEVLPTTVTVRNAKGKHFKVADSMFKGLYDVIKDIAEYKVVFTSGTTKKIFLTKDGSSVISAIIKLKDFSGSIVFLPYFDISRMTKYDKTKDQELWTKDAVILSKKIVNQLIEIEKVLKSQNEETPKPEWVQSIRQPKSVIEINNTIRKYEEEITSLKELVEFEIKSKNVLLEYSALLFENGKSLESAIEKSLKLLDYKVENFRKGDLEIDHIIVSPEGVRMIGESEGKDNTAIDITKFRQLESNINEDFERDEVSSPAKGLLFGNGFRFTEPKIRKVQFTEKCLTNAKRLRTALIATSDLYEVVIYILDNPDDSKFKEECRKAIETTNGGIVKFPGVDEKEQPNDDDLV